MSTQRPIDSAEQRWAARLLELNPGLVAGNGTEIAVPRIVTQLLAMGQPVVPLGKEKKKAIYKWTSLQEEVPTTALIKRWLKNACRRESDGDDRSIHGWGRITGAFAGVVELDFDSHGVHFMEEWGVHPHVKTKHGFHLILKHPGWFVKSLNWGGDVRSKKTPYPGVDIRADGGLSVVYGYGGSYQWLREPADADELTVLSEEVRRFFGLWEPPAPFKAPTGAPRDRAEAALLGVTPDSLVGWAMAMIADGCYRNTANFLMGCEFLNNGYSLTDALAMEDEFMARVPQVNRDGEAAEYTAAEFRATIRSAFQQKPRSPRVEEFTGEVIIGPETDPEEEAGEDDHEADDNGNGNDDGNDDGNNDGNTNVQSNQIPVREPKPTKGLDQLAHRWAREMRGHLMAGSGDTWFQYTGTHWVNVSPDDDVLPAIHLFLRRIGVKITTKALKEVRTLGRTDLKIVRTTAMNASPHLIPMRNGVFDLDQGKLLPHSPDNLLTYCLDYDYDPKADCPRFKQWLTEVLIHEDGTPNEEWIALITEWMGCCLTNNTSNHEALVNVGEGSNGKGTFARILRSLVGDPQWVAVNLQELRSNYHRASLMGKLVGFIDEPGVEEMKAGGRWLKKFTGEDPIGARHPYGKDFQFLPTTRFVVSCNTLPDTADLTRGYFRRLLIVEWRRKFGQPDPWNPSATYTPADTTLDATLRAELPGIFNQVVAALQQLRARGMKFNSPADSQKLKEEYFLSQDTVAQFLDECCERKTDGSVEVDTVYAAYNYWCERSGYRFERVLNKDAFSKRLNLLGFPKTSVEWDGSQKKAIRVRKGLHLGQKNEAPEKLALPTSLFVGPDPREQKP